MRRWMTGVALVALLESPGARAQPAAGCHGSLSTVEILGCLAGPPKTRGFPVKTRGIGVQGEEAPAANSVDLTINFAFGSAQLTNDGTISLQALGRALADPSLRGAHFRIAGHTDAVGSDAYNQRLSLERARAALAYLVANYGLAASSFDVVGFGSSKLFDPSDPTSAANRRVEVTLVTPAG